MRPLKILLLQELIDEWFERDSPNITYMCRQSWKFRLHGNHLRFPINISQFSVKCEKFSIFYRCVVYTATLKIKFITANNDASYSNIEFALNNKHAVDAAPNCASHMKSATFLKFMVKQFFFPIGENRCQSHECTSENIETVLLNRPFWWPNTNWYQQNRSISVWVVFL